MENISFVLWTLLFPLVWQYLTKGIGKKEKEESLLFFIIWMIYIWVAIELFR